MSQQAIVLFAHGARDPEWARPARRVAAEVQRLRPDAAVSVAFLEFMTPTLPEAVAVLCQQASDQVQQVDVLPFFIAQGGHLRQEVPALLTQLQTQYPDTLFRLLPPLGELPAVQDAMARAISGLL